MRRTTLLPRPRGAQRRRDAVSTPPTPRAAKSPAAATAPNGRTVADCWVIGLEDLSGDFTVSVVFADGEPRVVWNPDLNEGGTKDGRIYRLWGRETLPAGGDDAWTDVTDDPAPAGREFRFFRATVALPE